MSAANTATSTQVVKTSENLLALAQPPQTDQASAAASGAPVQSAEREALLPASTQGLAAVPNTIHSMAQPPQPAFAAAGPPLQKTGCCANCCSAIGAFFRKLCGKEEEGKINVKPLQTPSDNSPSKSITPVCPSIHPAQTTSRHLEPVAAVTPPAQDPSLPNLIHSPVSEVSEPSSSSASSSASSSSINSTPMPTTRNLEGPTTESLSLMVSSTDTAAHHKV